MRLSVLAVLTGLSLLSSACGSLYTVPKAGAAPTQETAHADEGLWTCPHEGGVFHHPGKCPNKWCGLDLVPLKK